MNRTIEQLYRRYAPLVHRRCLSMLSDPDLADDAMHDVFARYIESYRFRPIRYPAGLLYRMATNQCLNLLRRRGRVRYESDIVASIASHEDQYERIDARDLLRRLFAAENPSTRTMAYMYYVDGMKLAEVASEVGLSVPGVKKRLATFRRTIADKKEESL